MAGFAGCWWMILSLSCFAPCLLIGVYSENQWKFSVAETHRDPLVCEWLLALIQSEAKNRLGPIGQSAVYK